MKAILAMALALPLGCSLAPSDQVLEKLTSSERSWCVSVTSVYGTVRMGGSGARDALVLCNQEGLKVDGLGNGGVGITTPGGGTFGGAGSTIIIPSQPRVYIHDAPTLKEVDPSVFDHIRRGK